MWLLHQLQQQCIVTQALQKIATMQCTDWHGGTVIDTLHCFLIMRLTRKKNTLIKSCRAKATNALLEKGRVWKIQTKIRRHHRCQNVAENEKIRSKLSSCYLQHIHTRSSIPQSAGMSVMQHLGSAQDLSVARSWLPDSKNSCSYLTWHPAAESNMLPANGNSMQAYCAAT